MIIENDTTPVSLAIRSRLNARGRRANVHAEAFRSLLMLSAGVVLTGALTMLSF